MGRARNGLSLLAARSSPDEKILEPSLISLRFSPRRSADRRAHSGMRVEFIHLFRCFATALLPTRAQRTRHRSVSTPNFPRACVLPDASYHEYNLAVDPLNFDFLIWLIEPVPPYAPSPDIPTYSAH